MPRTIDELENGYMYRTMMTELGISPESCLDTGELLLKVCEAQHQQIKQLQVEIGILKDRGV